MLPKPAGESSDYSPEFFGELSKQDALKGVYKRTFLAENFGDFCQNWLAVDCASKEVETDASPTFKMSIILSVIALFSVYFS